MTIRMKARTCAWLLAGAVASIALGASGAAANVPLTRVSADPYTNASSQHQTEVEPDTFGFGSTVVAAFQVGRFTNGGSTDIGFARSGDGGAKRDAGFPPGGKFHSRAARP